MNRQSPLPRHITALYVVAVTSSLLLFGPQISMVGADIIVFSEEMHRQVEVEFRDKASLFGGVLPQEGLRGWIVYSEPANACGPVAPPPGPPDGSMNWILLIRRYDCTFEVKVRMAQNAHYHAAIVHNVNSTDLEPMYANNSDDINIPSVFVGEDTGLTIKRRYLYNNNYFVVINDVESFNINTHLLVPFATVVALCFLITGAFVVAKCLQDRRRQRRHRLSSSSLKKIPTEKFRRGETPYEMCAICLEEYQDGEKLRLLPCSHAYHSKCIDPWLTQNRRVCPTCKRKVFAHDEREEPDSDTDSDESAPLVRGGYQATQGGTFTTQAGNPVALGREERRSRSASDIMRGSQSTSSSMPDEEYIARLNRVLIARNRQIAQDITERLVKMNAPNISREKASSTGQGEEAGQMASGEHSINSRPHDLDNSGEYGSCENTWGSRVPLLGSRSESEAFGEATNSVEDVQVRTGSRQTSRDSDDVDGKPHVV